MKSNEDPILQKFLSIAETVPDSRLDITAALLEAFAQGLDYGRCYQDSASYYLELAQRLIQEGIDEPITSNA